MKLFGSVSWIAAFWVLAYLQLVPGVEGGMTFLQNTLDNDPVIYEGITTLTTVMSYSYSQYVSSSVFAYLYESKTNAVELGYNAISGQTGQSSFSFVISEQNVYDLEKAYKIEAEGNVTSIDNPSYTGFKGYALNASGDFALAYDPVYGSIRAFTLNDEGTWTGQYVYYGPSYGDTIAMSGNGGRVVVCTITYYGAQGYCTLYDFYASGSNSYFNTLYSFQGE